jgi:predicted AAA+ superfamily ATPase
MANYINRPRYLQQLIDRRDNGEVKIITVPRRSGKSWLLSHIYKDYLLAQGVKEECIVSVSLDLDEDEEERAFRKIVIVGDDIATYTDNNGIVFMGLIQFLLNDDILK